MSQEHKKVGAVVPTSPPHEPPRSSGVPPALTNTGLKLVTLTASESFVDGVASAPPSYDPASSVPRSDPYIGCTIDNRYKVEELLGEGGMGVVYRCRHKIIEKKVAMKVLRADLARDGEVTERFLLEAKAASAVGSQHIIDISDFGQLPDGSTYFVMEYLDGLPLSKVVEGQQPVPVPRILRISRQLAEGLAAAHEAGIVHRDLKPDNIFLVTRGTDKDFVKILDFGIAKVSSSSEGRLTRAGSVFGTPHYMSPEQAAGAPVDHRGDIYSFGVILYELACGRVPFDADNFMGILTQHMYKAPVPIRALVPPPQDIPPGLEAIILKCLSKRPEQRYADMHELIADLDKVRDGMVPVAVNEMMERSGGFNVPADFFKTARMPQPMPATPAGLSMARWPLYAGIAGVGLALVLVLVIFARSSDSPAAPAAPVANKVEPPKAAMVETASAPAPAEPPVKKVVQVALATQPLDAEVFRGDESLGSSPVVVSLAEGEVVDLEIRKEGFASQRISLDGSESKKTVRLEPLKKSARPVVKAQSEKATAKPAAEPAKQKPKSAIGGSDIVNPWAR